MYKVLVGSGNGAILGTCVRNFSIKTKKIHSRFRHFVWHQDKTLISDLQHQKLTANLPTNWTVENMDFFKLCIGARFIANIWSKGDSLMKWNNKVNEWFFGGFKKHKWKKKKKWTFLSYHIKLSFVYIKLHPRQNLWVQGVLILWRLVDKCWNFTLTN